jgi:hypothetical protein
VIRRKGPIPEIIDEFVLLGVAKEAFVNSTEAVARLKQIDLLP